MGYVFMQKTKFPVRQGTYLALCLFTEGREPRLFLVPSMVWLTPNAVFVDRKYEGEGLKSKPEWGVNVSQKNMPELLKYAFDSTIIALTQQAGG
jgi:hypothetical protein